MSIHVHKTGLNKTLGQQSDAVFSTNLIGDFQPSAGISAGNWANQVGSLPALRRFNSITHNNSTPHNFQFDGTNDYLGASSVGYGGLPFELNIADEYTLNAWWYANIGAAHNSVFSLGNYTSGGVMVFIRASGGIELYVNNQATSSITLPSGDAKWYYISLVHDGSGNYTVYVNGSYKITLAKSGATGTHSLEIGRFYDGSSYTYSANQSKVGHVHVYDTAIKNSQIRQNFLASHIINNNRVYGATYAA